MTARHLTLVFVAALAVAWGLLPDFSITLLNYIGLYALVAAGRHDEARAVLDAMVQAFGREDDVRDRFRDRAEAGACIARLHARKTALYVDLVARGTVQLRPGVARLLQAARQLQQQLNLRGAVLPASGMRSRSRRE